MSSHQGHIKETHRSDRTGWVRAAVLGANDGIVSISSLIMGVAAARASREEILVAGVAGLVAGAMSMAAGEYVSVSSQADIEKADLAMERKELAEDYDHEVTELATIYESRGVSAALAHQVAVELMEHDALGAHAWDELGIVPNQRARPIQAALASAVAFVVGGVWPLLIVLIVPRFRIDFGVVIAAFFVLVALGVVSARVGGAPIRNSVTRVTLWGLVAMAVTAGIGLLFGTVV